MHFLKSKEAYREGRALVFHNIDYLMMTYNLCRKNYMHLASCLVPMGDQIGMSQQEIADMLRTKTRRFTDDEIKAKFHSAPTPAGVAAVPSASPVKSAMSSVATLLRNGVDSLASLGSTRRVDAGLSHPKAE